MVNKKGNQKALILDTLDKFQSLCIGISRYDLKNMEKLKKNLDHLEQVRKILEESKEDSQITAAAQNLYHYMALYEEGNDVVKAYVGLAGMSYAKLFKRSLQESEQDFNLTSKQCIVQ